MIQGVQQPQKILHIFGRMVRGGAELRTLELMRHIDRERCKFQFCALSGLSGELDDEIIKLGGTTHYLGLGPLFLHRFRRLLREEKYTVVHSHVHLFSGLILQLAAAEQIPVRLAHFRNTHDGQDQTLRRTLQNRLMKYLLDRHATKILAVSEGVMASVWGPGWPADQRCEVIYNGFDFTPFAATADRKGARQEFDIPLDARLYIHVGRMAPAKNHSKLIAVFALIAARDPHARLLLVGRGGNDIETQSRELSVRLGVADKVILAGERPDVPRLLQAADLLLFPSLWEGLPGAVLEACAAGIPILASDLPGIREISHNVPEAVTCLPATASDAEWAEMAMKISAQPGTAAKTGAISATVLNSEFEIKRCRAKLYRAWGCNI